VRWTGRSKKWQRLFIAVSRIVAASNLGSFQCGFSPSRANHKASTTCRAPALALKRHFEVVIVSEEEASPRHNHLMRYYGQTRNHLRLVENLKTLNE